MRSKRIGGQYRFTYTNYGTPEGYPKYRAHSNQIVTITRKLRDDESEPGGGNKYMVKAADGWTGLALAEELRTPGKKVQQILAKKQKMLFIVCRFWLKSKNQPIQEFFTAHTTFDRATYQCDKLTKKFGPTFIIVEAPLDP